MEKARKFSPLIIFFIIIIFGFALTFFSNKAVAPDFSGYSHPETKTNLNDNENLNQNISVSTPVVEEKTEQKPAKFYIENVPFVVQAPNANWDELHEDACEEAALLTVNYYLNNQSVISSEVADRDILELVQFEKDNFNGLWKSTTAKETASVAEKKWGIKASLKYDITLDDIKNEIAKGNPVLLPTNGQKLQNPNYKQPGPVYHFLVAIGYNEKQIITNDPGTKRGKDYVYSNEILMNALGDWDGSAGDGKSVIIILNK
ncbi:MAG: C39 family peptidase [Patescibacteria group bacterium]|jgi:hypothetical protein